MKTTARFLLMLVGAVLALGLLADGIMVRTTRSWFEDDLERRARLSVDSARRSLVRNWHADPEKLAATLDDMSRDQRVLGAAACDLDGKLLAVGGAFPQDVVCPPATRQGFGTGRDGVAFRLTRSDHRGSLHVSALAVKDDATSDRPGRQVGTVLFVHDTSHVDQRERSTRGLIFGGLGIIAVLGAALTSLTVRLALRGWMRDVRRALRGETNKEMLPLARDVRELVDALVDERESEAREVRWNPTKLRATLTEHLRGERVVIVANREPYMHEHRDGGVRVIHPASGLVTALEPVMRACSGVWVAHGSGSADRETVDANDRVKVPPGEESYLLRRVWLTEEQEEGFYYGLSNGGLWPLCHVAHSRPVFRASDWAEYVAVNRKFADAVCEEVDSDDPIILVQDYHFALAPKMIRERLPRATIITFWHIPWPSAERFGICPWRQEIVEGLLGSSIVGFHTQQHCNNFIEAVDAFVESRIDRETRAVEQNGRRTLVRSYPISIEWPVRWLEDLPDAAGCREHVFRDLGLAPDALLGVGVDRLDYTKGIEERFLAVERMLERFPELRGKFTFVQLAAPSRTKIDPYRQLNERVEAVAARINERFGSDTYRPICLLRAHHEPPAVFRFYRAADVCYVSSLHDGMNLVAKEFVAARDDLGGALVLSRFTGAARELTEALIVNPYDMEQTSDALRAALAMPAEERRARMQAMRRIVSQFNVYRWAGRMLVDAAELRRRERLSDRLSWRAADTTTSTSGAPEPA
jgi:trehalose 6-phosphate synthase